MFPENAPLVCDECKEQYHGDCPVHGPVSELDPSVGYDQASLTYTQLPVPAQLTVRPSVIPEAGLGVFAVSFINKGVRFGPYEGRKVAWEDIGDLHNMTYAWKVSSVSSANVHCIVTQAHRRHYKGMKVSKYRRYLWSEMSNLFVL